MTENSRISLQVAEVQGVGTIYSVLVTGAHPHSTYSATVSSGPVGKVLVEGVSWRDAMSAVSEAVAQELVLEGATAASVGATPERLVDHYESRDNYGVVVTQPGLRARVRVDAYSFQSYAVAERWSDEHGWVLAYALEHSSFYETAPSYLSRDVDEKRAFVVALAERVLSGAVLARSAS